jgi:arginase
MKKLIIVYNRFSSGEEVKGMEKGPELYRMQGVVERLSRYYDVIEMELPVLRYEEKIYGGGDLNSLGRVGRYLRDLMDITKEARSIGLPLILGGDCCTALVSILGGVSIYYNEINLVFFDAHGDYNTPMTTPTGFLGGMGLAAVVGEWTGLQRYMNINYVMEGDRIALLGYRDLDPEEEKLLSRSGIRMMDAGKLKESDPVELLHRLGLRNRQLHIHIDPDVLDPRELPSLHYHVPDGLNINQLIRLLEGLIRYNTLVSMSINGLSPLRRSSSKDADKLLHLIERVMEVAGEK